MVLCVGWRAQNLTIMFSVQLLLAACDMLRLCAYLIWSSRLIVTAMKPFLDVKRGVHDGLLDGCACASVRTVQLYLYSACATQEITARSCWRFPQVPIPPCSETVAVSWLVAPLPPRCLLLLPPILPPPQTPRQPPP